MNKDKDIQKLDELAKKSSLGKKDFSLIYDSYHNRILDFVMKRVSSKEVAEDLTSDIFEKILKSVSDFQWQGITISAWIYRIARNRIIDFYRKNSKRKNDVSIYDYSNVIESKGANVENLMLEQEELVFLYNSIREFNEEDQYLIFYKFFEELPNKSIAKILKLTQTNVGTKLHRIRKKLKQYIKNLQQKNLNKK